MHLRREALPKFYKNSPQKTTTSQPAKVHTTERLATQPRPSSPLLACGHWEQASRLPTNPTTAPPAPQTLADRKLAKAPLGLQEPHENKAAPPFFTANKAPRPASATRPSRSTAPAQPLQPQGRAALTSPRPSHNPALARFSKSLALPTATPPNSLATV